MPFFFEIPVFHIAFKIPIIKYNKSGENNDIIRPEGTIVSLGFLCLNAMI